MSVPSQPVQCTQTASLKRLLWSPKRGSTSVLTLSRSFLILPVLASLSQLFQCSLTATNGEDGFHTSRVKFLFVNMFASCFLVSTSLIWLSTANPSQLWVRDTCLIGLLSLIKNVEHQSNQIEKFEGHIRRSTIQDCCVECLFLSVCHAAGILECSV